MSDGDGGRGVHSINNLGAILGSFVAGFVLIPAFGMTTTNLVATGLNAAVALTIFFISSSRGSGCRPAG